MNDQAPDSTTSCRLLYDGECPMCSAFAELADNAAAGQLKKINARNQSSLRDQATATGMDLDYGIVVEHQGKLHYGPDAVTYLASRKANGLGLKILYLPFRLRWLSRILYPVLVRIRWLLLRLKGSDKINNLGHRN